MVRLGKAIEGSGRARGAEGKVVEEGGEFSGEHGVQKADASAMEESGMGKVLGKPSSPAEAPSVQAGACEGSCDSAADAVGGTPDQFRLSTASDAHIRESPRDGRMQQQLEQELEHARLEYARQALWGEEYYSDGAGSDGYEGSLEELSARSDDGFDQGSADREELADGGTKTMGPERADTEVPASEVAPRPDPGWQYAGRADGVLQVREYGGGSRATTGEAGNGVDDARTGLGDADNDGTGLAMEAHSGAEMSGSESRALCSVRVASIKGRLQ